MNESDLQKFETLRLRQLTIDDFDALVALQLKCFPGMKPWRREQIASQLAIFPEGQIVIEIEGRIVASSSSLIVDSASHGDWHDWKLSTDDGFIRNHEPKGDMLYGIEIMVDPEFRGMKLSRRLYDARKQLVRARNLTGIMIGGRIAGYGKHADQMSARDYVQRVIDKTLMDPVLTPQLSNGFVLKGLIPDYFPSDSESRGYATFLEWTNIEYVPANKQQLLRPSSLVRLSAVQYQMRRIASFDEFATQCEFFVDVASDYKADFLLLPGTVHHAVAVGNQGRAARAVGAHARRLHQAICHAVPRPGDALSHQHRGRHAVRARRREAVQHRLPVPPRRLHRQAAQAAHHAGRAPLVGRPTGRLAADIRDRSRTHRHPGGLRRRVSGARADGLRPGCPDHLRADQCRRTPGLSARALLRPGALHRERRFTWCLSGCVGNLPEVEHADIHYAQSAILTPSDFYFSRDGIAAECQPNIETVIFAELDLVALDRLVRKGTARHWEDRRKDLYRLNYSTAGGPKDA